MSDNNDIDKAISEGIIFHGAPKESHADDSEKIKTKARKKAYITATHRTGAAKMRKEKREKRKRRNNRRGG